MTHTESGQSFTAGRGAQYNPANRFHAESYAIQHPEAIDEWEQNKVQTQFFSEEGKTIVNKVDSPDIPLLWSLNPYQGCEHGCVYCYARNSHEYWGFSAGVDFESKIVVKKRAPELLRNLFRSKSWKPSPISLSGNTDCYQPVERSLQITRQLLQVCLDFKNPVGIITKNALVLRDIDILQELSKHQLVKVYTSITSTDEELRRKLEPRTTTYAQRFQILEKLSKADIPCGVMNAPIIPGLNDHHMYEVLRRASLAGAQSAEYTMIRLNGAVGPIFQDWLTHTFPDRKDKIWNLIESCHGGTVSDNRLGTRMSGEGNIADLVKQQFALYCRQFKLNQQSFTYNTNDFIRQKPGQLSLF